MRTRRQRIGLLAVILACATLALGAGPTHATPSAPATVPSASSGAATPSAPPCAGWLDTFAPPPTIRVAHVVNLAVSSVAEMPFRTYVERALAGVMPTSPSGEAMASMATIVKQQAWFRALNAREGFWFGTANCFDVRDDIDLAPADPSLVTADDVAAVDATWRLTLRRPDLEDPFFFPYLRPGPTTCPAVGGGGQPIVGVETIEACAADGLEAPDILRRVFGPGATIMDVEGLGGPSRYETAANASRAVAPVGPVDTVYVATGEDYADAAAAGPAAARLSGSVLLVRRTSIPAAAAAELVRLRPSVIRIAGGPGAISDAVAVSLRAYAPVVTRLSGASRYETALAISRDAFPGGADTVFIATGQNFPDAISAGSAAAYLEGPVLLVPGSLGPTGSLQTALATELTRLHPTTIHIAGGVGAVSKAWGTWLGSFAPAVDRLAGADRYATSAAISEAVYDPGASALTLATGSAFPDALVAAPFRNPLLLVPPLTAAVPATSAAERTRLDAERLVVLGTSMLLSDDAVATMAGGAAAPTERLLGAYCCTERPGQPLTDADGIPMTIYGTTAEYNPVQIAQWGLSHQEQWLRSGQSSDRGTYLQMADWLVAHQQPDGRWLYTFAYAGQPVPWASSMAQGQGVSLLVRAWQETGSAAYRSAAALALPSMHRAITNMGVAEWDGSSYWLEEYMPPYSHHTLNGMLFSMEGLREWVLATGDPAVATWYRDSLATIRTWLPRFDTGSWSLYNGAGRVASTKYHVIHVMLLRHFARLTQDTSMATVAARWAAYAAK